MIKNKGGQKFLFLIFTKIRKFKRSEETDSKQKGKRILKKGEKLTFILEFGMLSNRSTSTVKLSDFMSVCFKPRFFSLVAWPSCVIVSIYPVKEN